MKCFQMLPMLVLGCTMFFGTTLISLAQDRTPVEVLDSWKGVNPESALRQAAPENGMIVGEDAWESLWTQWKGEADLPEVDFEKEFLLVATVHGQNQMGGNPIIKDDGAMTLHAMSTLMAGPGFGYLILKLDREGVVSVNGESLPDPDDGRLRISLISDDDTPAGLKRLNQFTQIYGYTDENVWIQFSFEERPFEASDPLAAVNRLFKYCSLEVRFPEEATENSRIYTQLRGPLRTLDETKDFQNMKDLILTFESCEDGRLKGSIHGTITRLTTRTEGPNQRTGDMMGFGHEDKDAEIPFIIEFDLAIE